MKQAAKIGSAQIGARCRSSSGRSDSTDGHAAMPINDPKQAQTLNPQKPQDREACRTDALNQALLDVSELKYNRLGNLVPRDSNIP